jgi:alkylation response protein AidB-like acyl-CoA dehydrogenase
VNPRDSDLKITSEGDEIVFNGAKNFNTGGVVSDLTVLEGVLEGTEDHIFTFVNTKQDGVQFAHNWDNVGLRLSESGGVRIDNIRVPWTDALGWDAATKRPIADVLGIPFATLLLPTIQLVFSNFYLGIAQGALDAAAAYTAKSTRAWPFGGDNKEHATEEWYILERYGGWHSQLLAADALLDRAGSEVAAVYREGGQHGSTLLSDITNGSTPASAKRSTITAARRGELAALVASGKVISTDTGLAVTSGIFEVLGSRATGKKYGFDRFWRDVRTHSLHDPVAYKRREVGSWKLLGERPEPTWYT